MKTITTLSAILMLSAGCGDTNPALVNLNFRLSCPSGATCVPGFVGPKSINQFNGAKGVSVSCNATKVDDSVDLNLSALDSSDELEFGISIRNLRVNSNTFALEPSACRAVVEYDDIRFGTGNGKCGSAAPSVDQPCQISDVSIDGSTVELMMSCEALEAQAIGDEQRDVLGNGSSQFASLVFENCSGL